MKNNSHHLPGMKSFKGKLLQITISNSKEKSFQIKNFFFEIIFLKSQVQSGRSKGMKVDGPSGRKWSAKVGGLVKVDGPKYDDHLIEGERSWLIVDALLRSWPSTFAGHPLKSF